MKDEIILEKWEFNSEVTNCFDDMLLRSIPQYEIMRSCVYTLGVSVLNKISKKRAVSILDIGCSNGLSLERFVKYYGDNGRFRGIDVSEPMLSDAKERFKEDIGLGIVEINNVDLRNDFPKDAYDLITSILTIQFTPIEYRQKIIQNIYDNLSVGGAFIMVEKVLGNCNELNELMIDTYLEMKKNNGYSQEQIKRKRMALEGVLVPVTSNWNIDLLKQAGFKKIDVFWRWMNFEGYIAIK